MDDGPRLDPALGNYASGPRFWDRQREVADIVAYLTDGQSVLVTGPRRVGKTSVVHQVLGRLGPSTSTVFVDGRAPRRPGRPPPAPSRRWDGRPAFCSPTGSPTTCTASWDLACLITCSS